MDTLMDVHLNVYSLQDF